MLHECVNYFKRNNGYKRIFIEMRKQWKKYGKVAGYIKLDNVTQSEREALTFVLGREFFNDQIKFSFKEFEQALSETKFRDIGILELLESYFSEKLRTNKAVRLSKIEKKQNFFDEIINELNENSIQFNKSIEWLVAVKNDKVFGYNLIISEYNKSMDNAYKGVINVCRAISYLGRQNHSVVRLAVLAAEITSNPHYFDKNVFPGKLLIVGLCFINGVYGNLTSEDIVSLYYESGIKSDDLSSHTTLFGINLFLESRLHEAYEVFIREAESYVVTLSNLNRIVKADCKSKIVFIIENQMLFSHMCEVLRDYPVSIMCTSGQMKTASLIVIDLLCKAGCKLYYSGDIDPEGIGIAQKILLRHPNNIEPWKFTKEDYMVSKSNELLEEERLKSLNKINDNRLLDVVEMLRTEKCAGYQELLMEDMIEEIKSIINTKNL